MGHTSPPLHALHVAVVPLCAVVHKNNVVEYSNGEWNKLGALVWSRSAHNVIRIGNSTLVIGGGESSYQQTEIWDHETSLSTCDKSETCEPNLKMYAYYPALFEVPLDYCK